MQYETWCLLGCLLFVLRVCGLVLFVCSFFLLWMGFLRLGPSDLLLILGADKAAFLQKVFLADVRCIIKSLQERMRWLAYKQHLTDTHVSGSYQRAIEKGAL